MEQKKLFPDLAESEVKAEPPATRSGDVRVVRPVRNQIQMVMQDLDATLGQDHPARAIWDMLERLDLSGFYASIQSVVGGPGRPASDPAVLLSLWVYRHDGRGRQRPEADDSTDGSGDTDIVLGPDSGRCWGAEVFTCCLPKPWETLLNP